jgi:hypothetical protein
MKTKNIEHIVPIRATPREIYDALMNKRNIPDSPAMRRKFARKQARRSVVTAVTSLASH